MLNEAPLRPWLPGQMIEPHAEHVGVLLHEFVERVALVDVSEAFFVRLAVRRPGDAVRHRLTVDEPTLPIPVLAAGVDDRRDVTLVPKGVGDLVEEPMPLIMHRPIRARRSTLERKWVR